MTTESVYCFCSSEFLAYTILTHLHNDGFGQETSVILQDRANEDCPDGKARPGRHLLEGDFLIAVQSDNPRKLERALAIFQSEDAADIDGSHIGVKRENLPI